MVTINFLEMKNKICDIISQGLEPCKRLDSKEGSMAEKFHRPLVEKLHNSLHWYQPFL
jgi:hypothetical protein